MQKRLRPQPHHHTPGALGGREERIREATLGENDFFPLPPRLTLEEHEGAEALDDGDAGHPARHEEVHRGVQPAAGEKGRPNRGAIHGGVVLREARKRVCFGGGRSERVRCTARKGTWRDELALSQQALSPRPPSRTMKPTSVMAAAWPASPPPRSRFTSSSTRSSTSAVRASGAVSGIRMPSRPAGTAPSAKPPGAARSSARSSCVQRTALPVLPRRCAASAALQRSPPSMQSEASPWSPKLVMLSQLSRRLLSVTCEESQVKSVWASSCTQPRLASSGLCVVTAGGAGRQEHDNVNYCKL